MPRRHFVPIAAGGLLFMVLVLTAYFRCSHGAEVSLPEAPPDPTPAGPPAIRFIGRFDRADSAGPRFAWSGSSIRARFRGTQAAIKLDDKGTNAFTVVVDRMPPRKILSKPQQQSYLLATGLAAGEHDVLVFKNTEASFGDVQFLGFDFGGGELVSPRVNPHKIELIGDSITAGSGVDAPNERCAFSPETENAFNAFGAIAARSLGADPIIVAASGRGVVRNADGSTVDTVPVLYTRTLPQYDWSKWDVSEWVPDAVVIDLGTNDFAGGDPGDAAFTPAYRGLLETVRKNYPSAHIFCALGSMLEGAELARARDYVKSAIKGRSDAGDTKVHYVDMEPLDAKREGLGCDEHPSLRTQRRMAAELVAVMKKTLDW